MEGKLLDKMMLAIVAADGFNEVEYAEIHAWLVRREAAKAVLRDRIDVLSELIDQMVNLEEPDNETLAMLYAWRADLTEGV